MTQSTRLNPESRNQARAENRAVQRTALRLRGKHSRTVWRLYLSTNRAAQVSFLSDSGVPVHHLEAVREYLFLDLWESGLTGEATRLM